MGRRKFDRLSAAVRRQTPLDDEWRQISYQVFEWPQAPGTFSERVLALQASIDPMPVPQPVTTKSAAISSASSGRSDSA